MFLVTTLEEEGDSYPISENLNGKIMNAFTQFVIFKILYLICWLLQLSKQATLNYILHIQVHTDIVLVCFQYQLSHSRLKNGSENVFSFSLSVSSGI